MPFSQQQSLLICPTLFSFAYHCCPFFLNSDCFSDLAYAAGLQRVEAATLQAGAVRCGSDVGVSQGTRGWNEMEGSWFCTGVQYTNSPVLGAGNNSVQILVYQDEMVFASGDLGPGEGKKE
ncbi:uncharacterized protein LOC141930462 isoform X3 [Strix aluco]|uniref:uncharacterized protein LOC141930462 isoform X3 n=1 Tax=Strix aluco TaxID=111821 RepID=UPI003DA2EA86